MTTTQTVSWEFGGWLAKLPPETAWTILGAGGAIGAGLIFWSYRRALVELPLGRCAALVAMRLVAWLAVLTILAAPTRVERHYEQQTAKPLAVLVDRSGSMTTPDNRQRKRLDDALARWRAMEPAARGAFEEVKTFAFADGMSAVSTLDAAASVKPEQTKLFASMQRVLTEAPKGGWGGVVVLTDGLDTAGGSIEAEQDATARAALTAGTPLFFVPGRNRYAGGAYFTLRDFAAPGQTAPRSTFRVEATFDSFQPKGRTVEVSLKVNGVARPVTALRIESGRRLATWSAEVAADAPGMIELELQAGEERARAAVKVEQPASNRILYYQGALDWSYRFLADILKRDSAFTLTPVFNFPNPNAVLPAGALARMPGTEAELAGFDIVMLANVVTSQLSPAQQTALDRWVRNGGVLLFLTPDDDSTHGFAGTELEKMLPVVFAAESSGEARAATLLSGMRNRGGGGSDPTKLITYAWEQTPHVKEIFEMGAKNGEEMAKPLFSGYAHVAGAKPGAEVLARHPTDTTPGSGERAILLALQRYGRGRTGVLTTDALWRWKLNEPTSERGAELFWQNLFAWLTRDRQRGMMFDHPPLHAGVNRETGLRLVGAGTEKVKIEAVLGTQRVALNETGADGVARVFSWRPTMEGFWQITATDSLGRQARHWLSVDKTVVTGEFSGLAPDEELLRALANRTGGAVLENTAPPAWQAMKKATGEMLAEQKSPLWDRGWILGALLALYGLELVLRRWWKML